MQRVSCSTSGRLARWACACGVLVALLAGRLRAEELPTLAPVHGLSWRPPRGEGSTFQDPTFGTPLRRLTDAAASDLGLITHDYSRVAPIDDTDRFVLVQRDSRYGVYTVAGQFVRDLPGVVGRYAEPRWVPGVVPTVQFIQGNELWQWNLDTDQRRLVARFPDYTRITSGGEGDIGLQDRTYAVWGERRGRPVEAFLIQIDTGETSRPIPLSAGKPNWVSPAPGNRLLVGWNPPAADRPGHGVELFDAEGRSMRRLSPWGGHGDVCLAADGTAMYVQSNAASPRPYQNRHWIVGHPLDGGPDRHLLPLTWEQVPHVSCRQGRPQAWAVMSLYVPAQPSIGQWRALDGEVVRLALDGSGAVQRLAHHRSRTRDGYYDQPRAAESRSGRFILFASNMGRGAGGPGVDVYGIDTGASGLSVAPAVFQPPGMPTMEESVGPSIDTGAIRLDSSGRIEAADEPDAIRLDSSGAIADEPDAIRLDAAGRILRQGGLVLIPGTASCTQFGSGSSGGVLGGLAWWRRRRRRRGGR